MNQNSDILKKHLAEVEAVLHGFPAIMGQEVLDNIETNFKTEGFNDSNLSPWQKRKYDPKDDGHPLLNKSGALKNSIQVKEGSDYVTIYSDLPYADIHNDGGPARAFGKYDFIMPKRKFAGDSEKVERTLVQKLESAINNIFR